MCESSDIFAFDQSIRGSKVPKTAAGNLFTEVPFNREDGKDPAFIRQIVTNGGCFKSNEVPLEPFLDGKVGRITSLASVAHSTSTSSKEEPTLSMNIRGEQNHGTWNASRNSSTTRT